MNPAATPAVGSAHTARGGLRDRHVRWLLVSPALVVIFAVSVWPMLRSLLLSFRQWRISRSPVPGPFVGLDNYARALTREPAFWHAAWVTLLYTLATVLLATALSLGLALLLAPGGPLRRTVQTLLILPVAMSPALIGISFKFMFNPEFGLLGWLFGVAIPPLAGVAWLSDPVLSFCALVLADVWGWTPFLTLVLIGGLAALPREAIEAARVDGAGAARAFRDITLPLLAPVIGIVVVLKTIFSLKSFDLIYLITNGGPGTATQTLAHYAYFQGFKYFDMGYAAAVTWLIVLPMLVLTAAYARWTLRRA